MISIPPLSNSKNIIFCHPTYSTKKIHIWVTLIKNTFQFIFYWFSSAIDTDIAIWYNISSRTGSQTNLKCCRLIRGIKIHRKTNLICSILLRTYSTFWKSLISKTILLIWIRFISTACQCTALQYNQSLSIL